jgi:hypothetical protein
VRDPNAAPTDAGPRPAVRSVAHALALGLVVLLAACTTPRDHYERAVVVVDQLDRPDAGQVARALDQLDQCIAAARKQLDTASETPPPSRHDRTAYLIPLAHLARARLHGRLGQVVQQEKACWDAVQSSEDYLGKHILALSEEKKNEKEKKKKVAPDVPFADYSVYFRREKIRRNAFSQLIETYRRAGERDLEVLMRSQVGLSDIYLRSPTAHTEEEYIRTIENSDWVQRNAVKRENVTYTAKVVAWGIYMVLLRATQTVQKTQLEQQAAAARDPEVRADLEQRLAQLQAQQQKDADEARETMQKIHRQHDINLGAIKKRHETTVIGALTANFELLGLSDEVKHLASYQRLQQKKAAFDNYVLRAGFDRKAAQALAELRSSLDQLSRDLQQRRRT